MGRLIGRPKGGMHTRHHAVAAAQGRPISLFVTARRVSAYSGSRRLAHAAFQRLTGCWRIVATMLIWFRDALKDKGITACIPGRKTRNKTGR